MAKAKARDCAIVLPSDGVVAKEFKAMAAVRRRCRSRETPDDGMILDIGSDSIAAIRGAGLKRRRPSFGTGRSARSRRRRSTTGTSAVARHVAMLTKVGQMVSVAGGGDTLAALAHAGAEDDFTYCSTAGGAFLEWLEGQRACRA